MSFFCRFQTQIEFGGPVSARIPTIKFGEKLCTVGVGLFDAARRTDIRPETNVRFS